MQICITIQVEKLKIVEVPMIQAKLEAPQEEVHTMADETGSGVSFSFRNKQEQVCEELNAVLKIKTEEYEKLQALHMQLMEKTSHIMEKTSHLM